MFFLRVNRYLISPTKIQVIPVVEPIQSSGGLDIFTAPEKDHTYCITVDVARGGGRDYSAFVVIDISTIPYKLVAKYRNNEIRPLVFPEIIYNIANAYNEAFLLVEINDVGGQVSDALHFDLQYENIIMCQMRGRLGQVVSGGFGDGTSELGIRTTKSVKKVGCSNLKTLIESDKLLICDFDIVVEMSTFIQKGASFEAEDGATDDLIMCLVFFAWLSNQAYFKEMTNEDIRKRLYESQKSLIEQDMAPFGFIDDGVMYADDAEFVDTEGDLWVPVKPYPDFFEEERH